MELAFLAWNGVPLWGPIDAHEAAGRLRAIASTYGTFSAGEILAAVPRRIQLTLAGIPTAAAAGDVGMADLMTAGEPERSQQALDDLVRRMPDIARHLE